jgi:hypothetical protein
VVGDGTGDGETEATAAAVGVGSGWVGAVEAFEDRFELVCRYAVAVVAYVDDEG